MQAVTSAVQRAGVNRSFTGMGSRSSSTPKLPMSRTASASILDNRQEQDAGDVLHAAASGPCAAHVSSLADKAFSVTLPHHHPKLHMMRQPCMHCLLPPLPSLQQSQRGPPDAREELCTCQKPG